jgi:hypothetical protein
LIAIPGNIMAFLFVRLINFGGERYVLLSSLDVIINNNDKSFNIGIRKYGGDYFSPKGHKYIEDFFQIHQGYTGWEGVILRQERLLVHYEEQFLIRLTIMEASEPMKIQVRPFLAFRNIHHLTHANLNADTRVEPVENGVRSKMYEGFPYLNMQLSTKLNSCLCPIGTLEWNISKNKREGMIH